MRGLPPTALAWAAACIRSSGWWRTYWTVTHSDPVDKGRTEVTKDDGDLDVFKIPILRNIAMTPPYFHDGSVATLPDAVRAMARLQLGAKLEDKDVVDIVSFLASLTGPLPPDFATAPVLPAGAVPGSP